MAPEMKTAIGLMSGTSMDGIDIALLKTDGEGRVERGHALGIAYPPAFRKSLAEALETAKAIERRDERPGNLATIERELTLRHAAAVREFLHRFNLGYQEIDYVGFHGQTVLHRPLQGLTVQLGDGALLARETGIPVIYDMRANDMVHGGQGAPLVPAYHAALALRIEGYEGKPVMFVNIGGISNLTFLGSDGELLAYDCGPGNTLIDQWVESEAGIPFDQGGAIAAEGVIVAELASRYLEQPFFTGEQRISLDRNDFRPPAPGDIGLHDGARTLAYVTAAGIVKSMRHLPERPVLIIACGGGRLNRTIMRDLADLAAPAEVHAAEHFGFNGDSMEAEAWAYLAVRAAKGLPLTYPGTTGVRAPFSGGVEAEPVILETERMRLVPWREGDAELIRQLHGSQAASRFIGDGSVWTTDYAEKRLKGWMADFQRDGMSKLKLVDRATGQFLGRAGFSFYAPENAWAIGYCIREDAWGRGYATEIAAALSGWFFAHRPEDRFIGFACEDNLASVGAMRKIGMAELGAIEVTGRSCRLFEKRRPR